MAHASNLSHRIERLLDDSNFRRAFGGTRRALIAALVIPAMLVACAALVHVQAAPVDATQQAMAGGAPKAEQTAAMAQKSPSASAPQTPSAAEMPQTPSAAATAGTPETPATPQTDQTGAAPQTPEPHPAPSAEELPPTPPEPLESGEGIDVRVPRFPGDHDHYVIRMGEDWDFDGGDVYAIVGDPGTKTRFFGVWDGDREALIAKARALAHGHFLLFRHDDKWYVVDDPAIVSPIEALDKQMQEQNEKMRDLGKQMRIFGEQERDQARKMRESTQNIRLPDLSKEMADLNTAVAELKEHSGGNITREQLQEIQRSVGQVQRQLMNAEIRVDIDASMREEMKQFGQQQGELGKQMGQVGGQIGETARETHEKVRSIIGQTLKNGQAKPVN